MISGALLREARLRAGLTQAGLARRGGTSQSAIARWEAGGSPPSLERLRGLLAECGFELRIGIERLDSGQRTLIESRLALTPEQRLDDLARTVRFLSEGRRAMAGALARQGKVPRRPRSGARTAG